jgi:hypothetical protein
VMWKLNMMCLKQLLIIVGLAFDLGNLDLVKFCK